MKDLFTFIMTVFLFSMFIMYGISAAVLFYQENFGMAFICAFIASIAYVWVHYIIHISLK